MFGTSPGRKHIPNFTLCLVGFYVMPFVVWSYHTQGACKWHGFVVWFDIRRHSGTHNSLTPLQTCQWCSDDGLTMVLNDSGLIRKEVLLVSFPLPHQHHDFSDKIAKWIINNHYGQLCILPWLVEGTSIPQGVRNQCGNNYGRHALLSVICLARALGVLPDGTYVTKHATGRLLCISLMECLEFRITHFSRL